jgi:hypothetical protein
MEAGSEAELALERQSHGLEVRYQALEVMA